MFAQHALPTYPQSVQPKSDHATTLGMMPPPNCAVSCGCSGEERRGCELFRLVSESRDAIQDGVASVLFGALPAPKTAEIYGVRYAVFERPDFGQLLVTRYGWPMLPALMPERWFTEGKFWRTGERLGQSTGTVYRFGVKEENGSTTDLVIKVSRYAQDVPFYADASFLRRIPELVMASLRFNNPFEEFGRLIRLRSTKHGRRLYTKRPLAIYSPPEQLQLWQHGRTEGAARMEREAVAEVQDKGRVQIELDPFRSYYTLFGWVSGVDASSLFQAGQLSETDMAQLTEDSIADLMARGMIVLDHKPAHIIVRPNATGTGCLRRSDGRIAYALVDFELLVDMPASSEVTANGTGSS